MFAAANCKSTLRCAPVRSRSGGSAAVRRAHSSRRASAWREALLSGIQCAVVRNGASRRRGSTSLIGAWFSCTRKMACSSERISVSVSSHFDKIRLPVKNPQSPTCVTSTTSRGSMPPSCSTFRSRISPFPPSRSAILVPRVPSAPLFRITFVPILGSSIQVLASSVPYAVPYSKTSSSVSRRARIPSDCPFKIARWSAGASALAVTSFRILATNTV